MKYNHLCQISAVILAEMVGVFTMVEAAPIGGMIRVDGSSTIFPISEAIAEDFGAINKSVRVTVGTSGTGGGFKKFCSGDIDINNASRLISTIELEQCKKNKISFIELPVAVDGLTVVAHPSNQFLTSLSLQNLKKIWEPGSKVTHWSDVNPAWPREKIQLFGPGPDSGTFDYFTETVNGLTKSSRSDYTASEDDNMLLKGVAASRLALGYFGHGYFMANKGKVKAVPLDGGKGPVEATDDNIANGSYPLARKLYIYVNSSSTAKPQVDAFVTYYLQNAKRLSIETGYLPLSEEASRLASERYVKKILGTDRQPPKTTKK